MSLGGRLVLFIFFGLAIPALVINQTGVHMGYLMAYRRELIHSDWMRVGGCLRSIWLICHECLVIVLTAVGKGTFRLLWLPRGKGRSTWAKRLTFVALWALIAGYLVGLFGFVMLWGV